MVVVAVEVAGLGVVTGAMTGVMTAVHLEVMQPEAMRTEEAMIEVATVDMADRHLKEVMTGVAMGLQSMTEAMTAMVVVADHRLTG